MRREPSPLLFFAVVVVVVVAVLPSSTTGDLTRFINTPGGDTEPRCELRTVKPREQTISDSSPRVSMHTYYALLFAHNA